MTTKTIDDLEFDMKFLSHQVRMLEEGTKKDDETLPVEPTLNIDLELKNIRLKLFLFGGCIYDIRRQLDQFFKNDRSTNLSTILHTLYSLRKDIDSHAARPVH